MTVHDEEMATFLAMAAKVSNWGRWGPEDERGTLNLITPDKIVAAAALVRTGKVFDLGIPLDANGPQGVGSRINPVHLMSETGHLQDYDPFFKYVDDYIFMPLQAASQWDALGHAYYDGQLYNGFPDTVVSSAGLARDSIDKVANGITGRGVLLDVAGLHGVDWLDSGYLIGPEDLEACAAKAGVEVGTGDILLFRTGWRRKFTTERSSAGFREGEPGLGMAAVEWLHERDVAVVASDNRAIEVQPGEFTTIRYNIHLLLLRDMGMTLGEILDFEDLAADCADDGVYEFFFCGPPLKVTGAAGSPINPLAIK
jgi:kynurenine formamidase